MSSRTHGDRRQQEAQERAAHMVPPGEHLVGLHRVTAAVSMPEPPRKRRAVVFKGRRMAGDRLVGVVYVLMRIITLRWNPVDAAYGKGEQRDRWVGQPFFGGWDSAAGQLVCGLFPLTGTGAVRFLVLTDRRLQVAYVQKARLGRRLGRHAEPGWALDLRQVVWIRDRSDVRGGTHEIGFLDGSWATVFLQGDGWSRFANLFPHTLRHTDPIPSTTAHSSTTAHATAAASRSPEPSYRQPAQQPVHQPSYGASNPYAQQPSPAYGQPHPYVEPQPYNQPHPYAQPMSDPRFQPPSTQPIRVPESAGDIRRNFAILIDGFLALVVGAVWAGSRLSQTTESPILVAIGCALGLSLLNHVVLTRLVGASVGKLVFFMRVVREEDAGRPRVLRLTQRWLAGYAWFVIQGVLSIWAADEDNEDLCGVRLVALRDLRGA
ncbi:RDD family protein [Streptomyces sp. NPDC004647]|uniref:RDD family protein n=1 Tax=Streptomyces sp. NPDC004647 TaxID=3154671 RepID=UPI0033B29FDA